MPNQGKIIDSLNRFLKSRKGIQIKLNDSGVCNALGIIYLLYKAQGQVSTFFELQELSAYLKRTEYEENSSSISRFCAIINFAYKPSNYKYNFTQEDVEQIARSLGFLKQAINAPPNNIHEKFHIAGRFSKSSLAKLLNYINDDELVYLHSDCHVIALYKQGGTYYLFDSSEENNEQKFIKLEELSNAIFNVFKEYDQPKYQNVYLAAFSNPFKKDLGSYPPKQLLVDDFILSLPKEEQQKALKFACSFNDLEMVEKLIEKGGNPFFISENETISPFILATKSKVEIIQYIFKKFKDYPPDQLANALASSVLVGHVAIYKELIQHIHPLSPLVDLSLRKNFSGNTLLHNACESGNLDMVQLILKEGELNSTNRKNETPLIIAAKYGHKHIVEYLLTFNEVKPSLFDAFECSLKNGSIDIAFLLLDKIENKRSTLQKSVEYGAADVVINLLSQDNGYEQSFLKSLLESAIDYQQYSIAEAILNHLLKGLVLNAENSVEFINKIQTISLTYSYTLKFLASNDRYTDLFEHLLMKENWWRTVAETTRADLILCAAKTGQINMVKMFVRQGFCLDQNDAEKYKKDLLFACEKGDSEAVEALITAGANPGKRNLFDLALRDFHWPIVIYLLKNSSDLTTSQRQTLFMKAIQSACKNKQPEIVNKLLLLNMPNPSKVSFKWLCAAYAINHDKKAKEKLSAIARESGHIAIDGFINNPHLFQHQKQVTSEIHKVYRIAAKNNFTLNEANKEIFKKKELLEIALKEKKVESIVNLLEAMPKLNKEDIQKLQRYRYQICDIFISQIKQSDHSNQETLRRIQNVFDRNNALGQLLHTPLHPFFFFFTLIRGPNHQRITRSIHKLYELKKVLLEKQKNHPVNRAGFK